MRHLMAAVIENHIDAAHFLDNACQKFRVGLRSDAHLSGLPVELAAFLVGVDAVKDHLRPEILAPHLQTAALGHADFQKPQRLVAPGAKIPLVNRQIVMPFVHRRPAILGKYLQQIAIVPVFLANLRNQIAVGGEGEFRHLSPTPPPLVRNDVHYRAPLL